MKIIVLTDKYIFNVEYQILLNKKREQNQNDLEFKLLKSKWALSIEAFDEMQLIGKDKKKKFNGDEKMIKIKINTGKNKTFFDTRKTLPFKKKTSVDFLFRSEKIARYFIHQIKRIYFDITKNNNIKIVENL